MRRYFLLLVLAILAVCCKSDDTVIQGSIMPNPGESRTVVGMANADDPTENNLSEAIAKIYGANYAEISGLSINVEGTINQADFASLRTFEVVDLTNANVVGAIDVLRGTYVDGVPVDGTVEKVNGNAIPAYIFSGENDRGIIEQITLPKSVTIVGEGAFKNCVNILEINAANVVTIKPNAFENCTGLTTISGVVKENVTETIGEKAFYNAGIAKLVIPASVASIAEGAFTSTDDATYYTEISVDGDGKKMDDGSYRLPTVVAGAFPAAYNRNCDEDKKYINLTGGTATKSFVPYEFCGWTAYSLKAGESTTNAAVVDFATTENAGKTLNEIVAAMSETPYALEVKGAMTVNENNNDYKALQGIATVDLTNATIKTAADAEPVAITEIPADAFAVQPDFTVAVNNLSSLTAVTSKAPVVAPGTDDKKSESLISITVPSTVTKIGDRAFQNCETLLYVNFAGGEPAVTEIGADAFGGCTMFLQESFDSMIAKATTMGDRAFTLCKALTYVNIPESMKTFGALLFDGCEKLEKISVSWSAAADVPNLGDDNNVFPAKYAKLADYSADSKYIIVPDDKKKEYLANGWEKWGVDDGSYIGAGAEYTTPVLAKGELDGALKVLFGDGYATGDPIEQVRIQGVVTSTEVMTCLQNFKKIVFVSNDIEGNVMNDLGADSGRPLVAVSFVDGGGTLTSPNSMLGGTWKDNTIIEEAIIPEGVTYAGALFQKCVNLKKVSLPTTVTNTNWSMFESCALLTEIKATGDPEKSWTEYIVSFNNQNTFTGCSGLKEIKLGPNLTTMGANAINTCESLERIIFSETSTPITIADKAIHTVPALKEIVMPWKSTASMPNIATQTALPSQFYAKTAGSMAYFVLPVNEDGDVTSDILNAYKAKKLVTGATWDVAYNLTEDAAQDNETQEGYLVVTYNEDATATEPGLAAVVEEAIAKSGKFWDRVKVTGNLVITTKLDDLDDMEALIGFKEIDLTDAKLIVDGTESTAIPASIFNKSTGNNAKRPQSIIDAMKFNIIRFGNITSIGGSSFQNNKTLNEVWFADEARFTMPTYTFNATSLTNESFNALLSHVTSFGTALSFNDDVVTEMVIPSTSTLTSGVIGAGVFGSADHTGLKALKSIKFSESITDISQVPTLGVPFALPAQFYNDYEPATGEIAKQYIDLGAADFKGNFTKTMLMDLEGWANVNIEGKGSYIPPKPKVAVGSLPAFEYEKGNLAATIKDLAKTSITLTGGIAVEDLAALKGFQTIDISGVSFDPEVVDPFAEMSFEGDATLTSIALPSLKALPAEMFSGCSALETVTIAGTGVFTVGDEAFKGTKVDNDGLLGILGRVSEMGAGAFSEISTLTQVMLATTVADIPADAFYGCTAVEAITIPASVKTIGERAFLGCDALDKITLNWTNATDFASIVGSGADQSLPTAYVAGGEKFITVDDAAAGAKELEGWGTYNVQTTTEAATNDPTMVIVTEYGTLEAAVKAKFGDEYDGVTVLDKIKVKGPINGVYVTAGGTAPAETLANDYAVLKNFKVVDLELATTQYQLVSKESVLTTTANGVPSQAFYNNKVVEEIIFPATANKINGQACAGCTSLKKVTMPTGNYSIEWSAFGSCTVMQNLTQAEHDRATSYGAGAFSGCAAFTSFTVGKQIKAFNLNVLDDCISLTEFIIPSATCSTIQTGGLDNCAALRVISLPYATASQMPTVTDGSKKGTFLDIFPTQFLKGTTASRYLTFPNASAAEIKSMKTAVISAGVTWGVYCLDEQDIIDGGGQLIAGGKVSINGAAAVAFEAEQLGAVLSEVAGDRTSVVVEEGTVVGTDWAELKTFGSVDLTGAKFAGLVPAKAFQDATTLTSVKLPVVTEFGTSAFSGCTALASLTIEGGVDDTFTLGGSVFSNCTVLADADLQAIIGRSATLGDNTTFNSCKMLTRLTNIRDEVTVINPTSFQNCSALQKVVIPAQITAIGNAGNGVVFKGCTALVDVEFLHTSAAKITAMIGANNTGGALLFDEVYTPAGDANGKKQYIKVNEWITDVTKLAKNGWEKYNFVNKNNYTGETIDPDGDGDGDGGTTPPDPGTDPDPVYVVKATIGDAEASYETVDKLVAALTAATDKSSVEITSVNANTALDFTKSVWTALVGYETIDLTGVNFGASVPARALKGGATDDSDEENKGKSNEVVVSVALPATVTSIGSEAFSSCSNLESVTVEGDHDLVLNGTVFSTSPKLSDACLQGFVKRTKEYLSGFVYTKTGITEVKEMNAGVTQIWPSHFNGCTSLTKVTIPATVTRFGDGKLTNGVFPAVTKSAAFEGCTNLAEVIFEYATAEKMNEVAIPTASNKKYIFDAAFRATATDKKYITVPATVVIEDLNDDWKVYNFKHAGDDTTVTPDPSTGGSIAGTDSADQSGNY